MKLKSIIVAALLMLAPTAAFAAPITYPGPPATDSSTGAAVTSGITPTITSVTDLDGNPKSSSFATAHVAGGNTSVVYDAAPTSAGGNGEAWVTETLTAPGHTFAPVVIFCSSDPSTLSSAAAGTAANGTGIAGNNSAIQANNSAILSNGTTLTAVKAKTDTIGTAAVLPATAPAGYGGSGGGGLSSTDLANVVQAIMTYSLHSGVSYQRAVAQIYLNTAAPASPTKSGTVQTNPFVWPDGAIGLTSTIDSSTGKRTETSGTLPN